MNGLWEPVTIALDSWEATAQLVIILTVIKLLSAATASS